MNPSRKIEITVDATGETTVEAHGYQGGTCKEATAPLTKALIGQPTKSKLKPEFYQPVTDNRLKEKGR